MTLWISYKVLAGGHQPQKATEGASGYDLCAAHDVTIAPGETRSVALGVAFAIPAGWEGQLRGRSGFAIRGLLSPVGTIDSDYRGEIRGIFHNTTKEPWHILAGARVSQIVFQPVPAVVLKLLPDDVDLPATKRGLGGFGSTGT